MKITKHGLDLIAKSPLDYWHGYVNPNRSPYKESDKYAFDKALRMAVLNRTVFDVMYVRLPELNMRTNIGKAEYASLQSAAAARSQLLLHSDDYDAILRMRTALLQHPIAGKWLPLAVPGTLTRFVNNDIEISFTPHAIVEETIINLTSTTDTSEKQFQKEADMFNWHKKEAIQVDGTGLAGMLFITCENKEPFNVGVYMLNERSVNYGRESYLKDLETFKECLSTDQWPGLTPKVTITSLPEWAFKK